MSLPTTDESKERELNHVSTVLESNGYPKKLISELISKQKNRTVVSPEELVRSFFELVERQAPPAGIAVLPYIKGLTEPLSRTLQKHDIKVYNKSVKTLERQLPTAKQTTNRRTKERDLSDTVSRLQLELHRRNRKIFEEEEVQTYKECETKQERVERRKTRMDSRSYN